jgi:hypothetical protein
MTDTATITTPGRAAASAEAELATLGLAGAAAAIRRGDLTSEAYIAARCSGRDWRAISTPSSPSTRPASFPPPATPTRPGQPEPRRRRSFWVSRSGSKIAT